MRLVPVLALLLCSLAISNVTAQEAPVKGARQSAERQTERPADQKDDSKASRPAKQLPGDQNTLHTLELPGRMLKFKATAGSIALTAADGRIQAEMGYVAYQLDGADTVKRPVAFAFNGGPGSASAWVHIGGFGPWRLPLEGPGLAPSALPVLLPNAETWLDFTDLVFVDPVGTGFSRVGRPSDGGAAPTGARNFYSVDGDADSVAEMIAKWTRQHGRLASPKLLIGESYGGIRAPKVLSALQTKFGVGMNAMLLISPVMDYGLFRGPRHHTPMFVNTLPSLAAAARASAGKPIASRTELAEVEAYARSDYVVDLLRGPLDATAMDRIVKRVAAISGLSEATVRRYGGRLDEFIYLREANRPAGRRASGYDATVTGDDPDPTAPQSHWSDPFAEALAAPMTSAMLDLYGKFGWKPDLTYNMLSREVLGSWTWGGGTTPPESFSSIRSTLALDPHLRIMVTHGFTDLRTPYFASALLLEQLPAMSEGRVSLKVYPGGHMHYSRTDSRVALRTDAKALLDAAIAADPTRNKP
jgi:carboxypeptidase C (cathepsin A)